MKLLLDTHALLWWLSDDERLGGQARDLIADPGNDVLVSAVSSSVNNSQGLDVTL